MVATVLAILPPLLYPFLGLLAALAVLRGGFGRSLEEAGWSVYLVFFALVCAALVSSVLAGVAARGVRVPAAVGLFVAVTPWLCGLAGMRFGMLQAGQVVAFADRAGRGLLMSKGFSEAITARLFGAWSTASLAAALGLSLAIGAAAQRAQNRRWAFAGVGLLLALPVVGVVGYAAADHTLGRELIFVALLAVETLVALPLAAGAAAGDAPHGRAASMASASVAALFVAWLAGAAALGSELTHEAFGALPNVDVASRASVLTAALAEARVESILRWVGGAALALATLVVAGWAATRARPSAGRLVGGAALVVIGGLALGTDAFARAASEREVAAAARSPWSEVAGFVPQELTEAREVDASPNGATLVLGVDGLTVAGEHVPASALVTDAGMARVAALVRAQVNAPGPYGDDESPEWLPAREDDVGGDGLGQPPRPLGPRPSASPAVAVAIDARVSAAVLRAFARGAARGGVHSLLLAGVSGRDEGVPGARETIAAASPAVAAMLDTVTEAPLLLETSLPLGFADRDDVLLHAILGAAEAGQFTARAGSPAAPLSYPMRAHTEDSVIGPPSARASVAYLALAGDATARSLAAAMRGAAASGHRALLAAGELPGHPEHAAAEADGDVTRAIIELRRRGDPGVAGDELRALLEQLGGDGGRFAGPNADEGLGYLGMLPNGSGEVDAPRSTTVLAGEPTVRGALSPEVVRRVVRRHVEEVRYCYERALAGHPGLAGRVTVQLVVGPYGAVSTSAVSSSTLRDVTAEQCVAAAARRWAFPSPADNNVVAVDCPFTLTPTAPPAPALGRGGMEGASS
jgi:hypothetical protein